MRSAGVHRVHVGRQVDHRPGVGRGSGGRIRGRDGM